MRIVAGKNRGTKLVAPENWNTRPTADRTRESLFGIIEGGRPWRFSDKRAGHGYFRRDRRTWLGGHFAWSLGSHFHRE